MPHVPLAALQQPLGQAGLPVHAVQTPPTQIGVAPEQVLLLQHSWHTPEQQISPPEQLLLSQHSWHVPPQQTSPSPHVVPFSSTAQVPTEPVMLHD
ncbi:MAG: hypothetical protein M3Z20_18260 [Chloroflexota bacterium]|nr:hypothetical protein [Chloroflexota bacterium]